MTNKQKRSERIQGSHLQFSMHYTREHRDDVNYIIGELSTLGISQAELGRLSGVPAGTVSQVLSGKYPSGPASSLTKMISGLKRAKENKGSRGLIPVVSTSVYRTVVNVCEEALKMRETDCIGLVCGHVGVGKSTAVEEYARQNPNVILVLGTDAMSLSELTCELCDLLHLDASGAIQTRKGRIIRALRNKERLLILDEASRPTRKVLEALRDIAAVTKVGLVFAGREHLYEKFSANQGEFAEISSRIMTRVKPIRRITKEDVLLIAKATFPEMDDESLDMIWQCSEANARELQKLLMKVSGWLKNKGEITPKIISNIYTQVIKATSIGWHDHRQ